MPNYRTKSEATFTTNIHQQYVNKTFSSTDAIGKTITYSDYKTEKNLVFSCNDRGLIIISLGGEEDKYDIPKGGIDSFFDVYAYLRGQFLDNICATTAGGKIDCLDLTIQIPGGVAYISYLLEYVYNMRDMKQPFIVLIESILLKRCMHYLFYAPTIGLYMLEPSAMDVLGKVVPLASVKQIQVDIGIYRGDITHKFNIQEEDNPKKNS